MTEKVQQYFCERCRYSGAVSLRPHAGVFEVMNDIESDHKANSPDCPQPVRQIRVRNVETCSPEEWAALTGAAS